MTCPLILARSRWIALNRSRLARLRLERVQEVFQAVAGTEWVLIATVRRRRADTERLAERMAATAATGGAGYAAIADAVREELAHDVGGPEPRHAALRTLGFVGLSEVLRRRVGVEP